MASFGHSATHAPQAVQRRIATARSSEMASIGQVSTQIPQPMQRSSSIKAVIRKSDFDSLVRRAALPAAADACGETSHSGLPTFRCALSLPGSSPNRPRPPRGRYPSFITVVLVAAAAATSSLAPVCLLHFKRTLWRACRNEGGCVCRAAHGSGCACHSSRAWKELRWAACRR
jgi:hypothetical protein